MDVFARCSARVGAARLVLAKLSPDSPAHKACSSVQKDALQELLETKECRDGLSCEQRASLQDLIMAAPYVDDDKSQCLISLAGGQSRKPRTKQQDATHCLEYLSEKEWQLCPRLGQLGVLQLLFDVLASRMQCFNPTEPTLKWVASSVIVITTPKDELALVTEDQKKQMQNGVRRKLKQFQKHNTEKPIEQCLIFPSDPHALEQKHPALFAHIKAHIGGSFTANQLCTSSLLQLDQSYQCRGGGRASSKVAIEQKPPDAMMAMAAMMSMLLQKQRGDSHDEEGGLRLEFPNGRKRCLMALEGSADAGESQLRRARTLERLEDDASASKQKADDEVVAAKKKADDEAAAKKKADDEAAAKKKADDEAAAKKKADDESSQPSQNSQPSQSSIAQHLQITAPSAQLKAITDRTEPEKAPSKAQPTPAASLIDALVARDAERAQVSKDKAAAKKAAAKLEKENAAKLEKENVKPGENVPKKKHGQGKVQKKNPTAAKQGKLTAVKKSKPSMSHEASRTQYLVRTGLKGTGQSSTFKYGEEAGTSQADAQAAANQKLKELESLQV
jgi:hypothetical protein